MTEVIRLQAREAKVSFIKPRDSQIGNDAKTYVPTIADASMADWYLPTLFAYRLDTNSDEEFARFLHRIKDSLARILVPFFPFAGRWEPHEKYVRQLVCNDAGVPFVEARFDEHVDAVVDSGIGGFRPVVGLNGHEALGMDPSRFKQDMLGDGMPPVFAQVRSFIARVLFDRS